MLERRADEAFQLWHSGGGEEREVFLRFFFFFFSGKLEMMKVGFSLC